MKKKFLTLVLCATLTLSILGAFVPDAEAANASGTVYTFGNAEGPWRDLYAEHQKEAEQRKKDKKKTSTGTEQERREKFARMKAQRRK